MTARLAVAEAGARLAGGGVLLLATDTLPGLHCRADRADALDRLLALKGRPPERPLLLLCASLAEALALGEAPTTAAKSLAARCWPGPFTLVLPRGEAVPARVSAGLGTVALRVPGLAELRQIVGLAGFPLVSTSANRSGEEPSRTLAEAAARFADAVDGIWGPAAGDVATGSPSTLADLTTWPPRVLREGARPLPPWRDLDGTR
jgi:L-threonylcarbamoyladenylate synthase